MRLSAMLPLHHAPAKKTVPAKWRLCLGLAALALTATYLPHGLELLRLERGSLVSGEVWRLLSGHLVHLNTPHLAMNLLALFLLCELVWRDLDWRHGVGLLMCAALTTSAALLAWHPEIGWYAGLSGALHGLWAGCALHGLGRAAPAASAGEPKRHFRLAAWSMQGRVCALALALLSLKLAMEYCFGPSQRTAQAIGGTVVAVSHAYGALAGGVYLAVWRLVAWRKHAAPPRFRLK